LPGTSSSVWGPPRALSASLRAESLARRQEPTENRKNVKNSSLFPWILLPTRTRREERALRTQAESAVRRVRKDIRADRRTKGAPT
jgi:hypothetical protein